MDKIQHLFQGINEEDFDRMMICFHASEKWYQPGEFICSYGTNTGQIGVVMEGAVQILRTYADGRQTILEHLEAGNLFGESLSFISLSSCDLQVYSTGKTRILYIDYSHLIKRCPKACTFHSQLVNNTLQMMAQKTIQLSERLEVLSQRTTREKLQCYFSILASQNQSQTFHLPFSYSSLADYLSVDRSAMMREIKKMKEDGLLRTDRHEITLTSGGSHL